MDKLLKEHNITLSDGSCPAVPDCSRIKQTYRTYDGSCNNLKNPKIGMKNTPYQRILKNAYSDRKCFILPELSILRKKTLHVKQKVYLSGRSSRSCITFLYMSVRTLENCMEEKGQV